MIPESRNFINVYLYINWFHLSHNGKKNQTNIENNIFLEF